MLMERLWDLVYVKPSPRLQASFISCKSEKAEGGPQFNQQVIVKNGNGRLKLG